MRSLVLSLLLALVSPALAVAQDSLLVVIRVDDVLSRSSVSPRSLVPFESAVEARGGKVTWAVIPHRLIESQNRDGALAAELRQTISRGHEVSLHGYSHICQRCGLSSHEMWCLTHQSAFTYDQQAKLIDDGLAILEREVGVRPTSFVPPGYHADSTTYRVLGDQGMAWISTAGADGAGLHPSVFNLVRSEDFNWAIDAGTYQQRLAEVLDDVRARGAEQGYYVLVLHDPFTRPGYANGLTMQWIGDVLDALNVEHGGRVRYRTLSQAADLLEGQATSGRPDASASPPVLLANAPNPFAHSTTFRFHLATPGPVTLAVYDLLGRQVAVVLDEHRSAGPHAVSWSASGLPGGTYLYRLRASEALHTSRLVLTR
jgi:peptidoglycan/xylan/chitin deacetylase (PgdA/CDA1 family)